MSGDGITGKAPDFPQTRLAFRAWRFDKAAMAVLSLNAPTRKSWLSSAMASPAGRWPHKGVVTATCNASGDSRHDDPVPSRECKCGIYATTDLDVINSYLRKDSPILGVVEMGGKVIPATQGYRAAYARVAAILLIDEALTEPHSALRKLAEAYRVPAVVPHSVRAEDYRWLIRPTEAVVTDDEITKFLAENQ